MSKLMGFDFRVEYKAGKLNRSADALSRRDEDDQSLMAISFPHADILEYIRKETETLPDLLQLRKNIEQGKLGPKWSIHDGLIFFKERIHMLPTSSLIPTILSAIHDT
jgi:hypothetical protein